MKKVTQKVCLYARVSTSHHRQNPMVQMVELRRGCAARGWAVAEEITDHGFSGGSAIRPGLKRLEAIVKSRQVDIVVVTRLDRLFRSTHHLLTTVAEFTELGVEFVSIKEAIDLTTASGKLLLGILAALGELERDLLRERTMSGLAYAKAKGKRLGRPRVHNPAEIRRLRATGLSYRANQSRLGAGAGAVARALASAPKTSPEASRKRPMKSGGADV